MKQMRFLHKALCTLCAIIPLINTVLSIAARFQMQLKQRGRGVKTRLKLRAGRGVIIQMLMILYARLHIRMHIRLLMLLRCRLRMLLRCRLRMLLRCRLRMLLRCRLRLRPIPRAGRAGRTALTRLPRGGGVLPPFFA